MWGEESKLAAHRLQANNERPTVSPSAPPEIYKRTPIRLPSSLCKSSLRTYFDWEDSWNDDYAKRPVLLDSFSGSGGCAVGYYLAGFRVIGVDKHPQPHYPFKFYQADAIEYIREHGHEFDVIHASPPCQRYSECTPMQYRANHPDLIAATRDSLRATGKPYVIENVENARALLINPVMLCGSMFGLGVWRHRYFELWPARMILTPVCNHTERPVLITGTTRRAARNGGRFEYSAQQCRDASGLDWMTRKEMDEAIPPAYTEFIGSLLMEKLGYHIE